MPRLVPLIVLFVSSLAYYYYSNFVKPNRTNIDPEFRSEQIENIILQTWIDYKLNGWGKDIYHPINHRKSRNMPISGEPLGWIIIDALDTLLYVHSYSKNQTIKENMQQEIENVADWCINTLNYDIDANVNIFETTIRMLGGLLSSYYLTETTYNHNNRSTNNNSTLDSKIFLEKAIDLANRLIPAFSQSTTGIPYSSINLHSGHVKRNHANMGTSSTAEFTTLQLEFKYLSILTGDDKYWKYAESVYEPLYTNNNLIDSYDSLIPIYTFPNTGKFYTRNIRMGSRGDSFYEYLLKQYLFTHETLYYQLYRKAMDGMKRHLLRQSSPNKLVYIAERPIGLNNIHSSKMDHLVCFMGGLLAMGATEGITINKARTMDWWNYEREQDWLLAQELTYTCYQMYKQTPTGLAPEIVVFNDPESVEAHRFNSKNTNWWISPTKDFAIKPLDAHNLQRPETVESIMILYHITKDKKYRQWGAEILDNFIKHSCIHCDEPNLITYTSLDNMIQIPTKKKDNLESFWIAETLKYLYLLFQDDFDLTKVVFNTEAHPFPVINEELLKKLNLTTGWNI